MFRNKRPFKKKNIVCDYYMIVYFLCCCFVLFLELKHLSMKRSCLFVLFVHMKSTELGYFKLYF
jgi:hypothetical protein